MNIKPKNMLPNKDWLSQRKGITNKEESKKLSFSKNYFLRVKNRKKNP